MNGTNKPVKGLESLIEAVAVGLREKRDFPGRWCEHFTEGCIERMRQYGETGALCEHKCEYCKSFKWAVDRAKHYEEKTGIPYLDVLKSWEEGRDYWFLNYYQDCKQPKIKDGQVRMFDTRDAFFDSLEASAAPPVALSVEVLTRAHADGAAMACSEPWAKVFRC